MLTLIELLAVMAGVFILAIIVLAGFTLLYDLGVKHLGWPE